MNEDSLPKKGFILWLSSLFHKEPQNREELVELIRDSEHNELIDQDTRDMLEGVMDIVELRVRDIMIPRPQIIALKTKYSLDECLNIIIESAHSRFPVISDDKDHLEGFLLAKDLLPFMCTDSEKFDIKNVIRPGVVVPESKRVDQMLKEFRAKRYHMAIVVDEFGRISGLVTIEDILELIVGDIEDEYDEAEDSDIRQIDKNTYSIQAITPIEEFNEFFSTSFNDDDADTVGGLVLQAFGYLPTRGKTITIDGYTFKINLADSRRIIQLHLTVPSKIEKTTSENE